MKFVNGDRLPRPQKKSVPLGGQMVVAEADKAFGFHARPRQNTRLGPLNPAGIFQGLPQIQKTAALRHRGQAVFHS